MKEEPLVHTVLRRCGAAVATAAVVVLAAPALPANAQQQLAPAAAADAYGLDIDVTLPLNIDIDQGPFARSTQEYPPTPSSPIAQDAVLGAGPLPTSGEAILKTASVIGSSAQATAQPKATARAYAKDLELLTQGGVPLITADVLTAVSTTDCTNAPSAAGTEILGVKVATIEETFNAPTPNYVLAEPFFTPLGLKVVLNEQQQTADGRGLVVNALHVYQLPGAALPLLTGDIIVSHAMSTVNCPNGAPTTGGNNPIFITKDADKATARAGDTVTYTATVQNKHATLPCAVNQFIDHLPSAFDFVSTSGAFGTVGETEIRPGGGTDVVIKPNSVTIPAGGSATQTFVLKVRDDAVPAVYFNNVEILCGALGNWVKGLDAPVEVVGDDPTPSPSASPQPDLPECSDKRDNDGDGFIDYPRDPGCPSPQDDNERDDTHPRTGSDAAVLWAAGALLIGAAYGVRRLAVR